MIHSKTYIVLIRFLLFNWLQLEQSTSTLTPQAKYHIQEWLHLLGICIITLFPDVLHLLLPIFQWRQNLWFTINDPTKKSTTRSSKTHTQQRSTSMEQGSRISVQFHRVSCTAQPLVAATSCDCLWRFYES